MNRSLVVGGNGFIGSHLVDMLASLGHQVTAFDRFSRGNTSYTAANVTRMQGDFLDRNDLQQAVDGQDFVFHFLSTTTPATAEKDPTLDIRVNVIQSLELFSACADAGVKRVYFASTGGAIYQTSTGAPLSEVHPTMPISPYAIGKLALEQYLEFYRLTKSLDYMIYRIANPYGPRQHPEKRQGIIPIVLRNIAEGRPVLQYGDGSMVRDFIYITDLMRMISATLEGEQHHRLYNLGSGVGHSVSEILAEIRVVTGIDFPVEVVPNPNTFLDRVVLDIGRVSEDFRVAPLVGLSEGIRATWKDVCRS